MQLTCRRCNGTFTVAGPSPTPCPACGSIDVYPAQSTRSPLAKTTERTAFSAPVSQPVSPMPPPAMMPYAQSSTPSYPAPPPQYQPGYPQAHQQQPHYPPQYQQYPQPVQLVIQNHIGAPTPYAMAPYARRKDAGVATLLSFFLPGAGQLYNGQVGKGVALLLVSIFVNFPLMFVGVGFITGLITWIWAMIDAHSSAEKINRGEIVV